MTLSEDRLRGIFWGGLAGGLATAIPLIGWLNCFCCLWGWIAGAVAVAIVARTRVQREGEGAATGALAGAFAGLVSATLELLWTLTVGPAVSGLLDRVERFLPEDLPSGALDFLSHLPESGLALIAMQFVSAIFSMVLFAGFGALGALIYLRLTRPAKAPPTVGSEPAADEPAEPQ